MNIYLMEKGFIDNEGNFMLCIENSYELHTKEEVFNFLKERGCELDDREMWRVSIYHDYNGELKCDKELYTRENCETLTKEEEKQNGEENITR